jgi:hypothetical protein
MLVLVRVQRFAAACFAAPRRMSVQAHYSTGKGGLSLAQAIVDAAGGTDVKVEDLIGACEFHTGGRAGTLPTPIIHQNILFHQKKAPLTHPKNTSVPVRESMVATLSRNIHIF